MLSPSQKMALTASVTLLTKLFVAAFSKSLYSGLKGSVNSIPTSKVVFNSSVTKNKTKAM